MKRGVTPRILKVGTEWRCFVDSVFRWNGTVMDNIIYSGYFYCDTCSTFRSRRPRLFYWTLETCFRDLPSSVTIFFFAPSKVCVVPTIVLKVLNRVFFLRCFYEHNSAQVKTFGETTNRSKSQQLCDTELVSGVIAWFDVASQLL